MIIGQFCDVYPPETDGVGMVVKSYTEELTRMGNSCFYIAPKSPLPAAVHEYQSYLYMSFKLAGDTYRAGVPGLDIPFRIKMNRINFDIIHAHSPFAAGREAIRLSRRNEIPLVGSFHSKYYDDFYKKTHSKVISRMLLKYVLSFYNSCDEVWAVNAMSADVLRSYGFTGEIQVMPNGTDLWFPTEQDKAFAEERFGLGRGTVLLFVGQQNWKKNIKNILKAAKIYSETGGDFKLVFAGQGPDAEQIKKFSHNIGLGDKTVFTGHISDRSVLMSLYARADLLVFPSLYDTHGMVVREAAATGTPSLLIRGTCASEGVEHNQNGFLCEDTPESIAECIKNALPVAEQIGAEARETLPLSWSKVMESTLVRYKSLIARTRAI